MEPFTILGFALGLVSAVFFAFYMVPQKVTRMETLPYIWLMSLGVVLVSAVPLALTGFPHQATWAHRGWGLLCGAVWALGTVGFAAGIAHIGLALATPIKNTTAVLGTLVGLLFLQEWRTTKPLPALIGSVLIAGAAILIGLARSEQTARRGVAAGVAFSLFAAVAYSTYGAPMKETVRAIGYWEFTPWMGLGMFVVATLAMAWGRGWEGLRRISLRDQGLAMLGGLSWTLAFYALAGSMVLVDFGVAWSLSNLNTVPAVLLGMLVFHEVDPRAHGWKIAVGLAAAVVGTVFLGLAKAH